MTPLVERRQTETPALTEAMASLVQPSGRYLSAKDILLVLAEVPRAQILELASLPLGSHGQRLVALRYFLKNGRTWLRYYSWKGAMEKASAEGVARVTELGSLVDTRRALLSADSSARTKLAKAPLDSLAQDLEKLELFGASAASTSGLDLLLHIDSDPDFREELHARLCREASALLERSHRAADLLYLATYDLGRLPATTVGEGDLAYLIVADKGEMGVRAVREAVALGLCPVVLFSQTDDDGALQVRLCHEHGGFAIPLHGSFRETYGSFEQIARRVLEAYAERFGDNAAVELGRSALYPGYGPLAENTAAIEHFRKSGIAFVGPMQDVVERAGDKRKFRLLAESIDPKAVVPGIVMDDRNPDAIVWRVNEGHQAGKFTFPGRLKAANGGGGRGQMVIPTPDLVEAAVRKVLSEIQANGWDPGVMFEQNIPETVHLEVQVMRDRFGNTRHFGMRDCTEQRASQKIQEEAPPALLRHYPGLEARICETAVKIADAVGYVGACTVELMFKSGHFYLLEMNTRIQVEHPVTEAAHRIRVAGDLTPLNLVALQFHVARGLALPFAQSDIIQTHVAREFRINAESWNADMKDSRDGKKGLFVPNGGEFQKIELPSKEAVLGGLDAKEQAQVQDLQVRLDSGFEAGDRLLNKDPTFAKLIVSLQTTKGSEGAAYELLRRASIEVLKRLDIRGVSLLPSGKTQDGMPFKTNIADHIRVLESEMLITHSRSQAPSRHVNWVVQMLRSN